MRHVWLVVLAIGCSRKSSLDVGPEPFGNWNAETLLKKLEGSWVVEGNLAGTYEAWQVNGKEVRIYVNDKETTADLEVSSPCTIGLRVKDGELSMSTSARFAWDGDVLWKGLGMAGVIQGGQGKNSRIVACLSSGVFTFQNDVCKKWEESSGTWQSSPATCSRETRAKGEVFIVKEKDWDYVLARKGDIFLDQQMADTRGEHFESFEAAKAKLTR